MAARRTILHDTHVSLGAKMADFGGWDMPIEYPTGVVAEHMAVRTVCGVFDVSHMGQLRVRGEGSVDALNGLLANDLRRIGRGKAQYSMLLTEAGGVVDDLIVYLLDDDDVLVVPNAANADAVQAALRDQIPWDLQIEDHREQAGIIAVQGPDSPQALNGVGIQVDGMDYMSVQTRQFDGREILVGRSGYTGEVGFEVMPSSVLVPALWDGLLSAGAVPSGLGARDTLRTEMGYPLHGQELTADITPLEAGLSWAVGWDKPRFRGREALLAQREQGRKRALRGIQLTGRGVPRPHMSVRDPDGRVLGETTSGTFSPSLRAGIALALLPPVIEPGMAVEVDIRGRAVPAVVVKPPFVPRSPR